MREPLVKYDHLTDYFFETFYPPYASELVSQIAEVFEAHMPVEWYMQRAFTYRRELSKHRERFEYYTSRMPFPREWFMFDFSSFNPVSYFPYELYKAWWSEYERGHEYRPENFRSLVFDYNSPIMYYIRGQVDYNDPDQRCVVSHLRSKLRLIDVLYDLVVRQGKAREVEEKYGYTDYMYPDIDLRVPNLGVHPGHLLTLLTYVIFWYFPDRHKYPVPVVYQPSVAMLAPARHAIFFPNQSYARKYYLNFPKDPNMSVHVHWFESPFYWNVQPAWFEPDGTYVLGYHLDELTWYPSPPAKLGRTWFIGTEFLKPLYYAYKLSRIVRYMTYDAGHDKYPPPFDRIDLVEEHPVAALAFLFLLAHRLAYADSATYRATVSHWWMVAKEVYMYLGVWPPTAPPSVFRFSKYLYFSRKSRGWDFACPLLRKFADGWLLFPEVVNYLRPEFRPSNI